LTENEIEESGIKKMERPGKIELSENPNKNIKDEKRKDEEYIQNLTEEEKIRIIKEKKREALQKKLEGLSEEEKKKTLEELREKARQKKLDQTRENNRTNIDDMTVASEQSKKIEQSKLNDRPKNSKDRFSINEKNNEKEKYKETEQSKLNDRQKKLEEKINKKKEKTIKYYSKDVDDSANNLEEEEKMGKNNRKNGSIGNKVADKLKTKESIKSQKNNIKNAQKEAKLKVKRIKKEEKLAKKNGKKNTNGEILNGKNYNKKNKSEKKSHKKLKIAIVVILLIAIIAGIVIGKRIKDNGGGMQGIVATILGHDSSTLDNLPELRFVIIGQSQNLTDTIMVCSYNPRSQKASILSIPRDTYTGTNKSRATAYEKINAMYQENPDKLLKKLSEITGMELKYYVHVDTEGLVDLVDAIGGVDFDVPINMKYDDTSQKLHINLKAGPQLLNGDKAEQLVRFRHNNNGTTYPSEYGQEDIGRMKTQREFIKAVIKKMAKAENITKVDDFIKIGNKYVTTNMNFNAFKDYAPYALSFSVDNVRTETLPGAPEKINGLWFYSYNKKETLALVKDMFALEPEKTDSTGQSTQNTTGTTNSTNNTNLNNSTNTDANNTEKTVTSNVNVSGVKVEILNGTSNSKNLTNLKTILQNAGFKVSKTGTTSATSKTTIVNRTGKSDEIAEKLKNTVGAGVVSTGSNNSGVDFTIVIGSDF